MYSKEMGTSIECVHCSNDLGRMLPLSSLGEAGAPSVEDLVEGSVNREGEGALEKGSATWPGDPDRGELLQHSLEVASS